MRYRLRDPKFIWTTAFFLTLLFSQSALAAAGSPLQVVKSGTERALTILKSSQTPGSQGLRPKRDEILTVVDEYFNFEEMGRRSLGRPWKDQPADKRQEFIRLFKNLLFNTYIDRVETYTISNEQISYDSEKIDGDYAVVKTRVLNYKDSDIQIDYRLHLEGGVWRVYDVVAEGVSFVDNYRSQFASILANEPFDGLLKKLRDKV
jgi:phospholipid transport system substrate-binding protein